MQSIRRNCKIEIDKSCCYNWYYNICTVKIIFENLKKIVECFEELEENCHKIITCKEAHGLHRTLEDADFVFCPHLFNNIFPYVEILFRQFQARQKDSDEILKDLEKFEKIYCLLEFLWTNRANNE